MIHAFFRLQLGLTLDQIDDLLRVIDKDGSGSIDYTEFEMHFRVEDDAKKLADAVQVKCCPETIDVLHASALLFHTTSLSQ